ncbi:hypothetical protein VTN77DRAFT_1032 [Rasamsonia byssochlamydoides]|uniref:uncharacterized protein n=1 Tax=Rasamsonia byssochlamydoides TaxID=89139 RepID=UPI0037443CC3
MSAYPRTIEDEGFPADLDGKIDVLKRNIAAGYLVDAHQVHLDRLLAKRARMTPIDEGELQGLMKEVYERICVLKPHLRF